MVASFHTGSLIFSLCFSPDGRELVAALGNGQLQQWSVGQRALVRTLGGHMRLAGSVSYSPDGRALVSGSEAITM